VTEPDPDIYRERAHLVALLTRFFPSCISYNDPSEPDWPVVYMNAPTGQLSWHISPSDVHLFAHVVKVEPGAVRWDGHTTPEKYERIRELTRLGSLR
jgi:hypothetical protein